MDAVGRALVVYLVLLATIRVAGQRTLSEMTAFDLVLLLVVSEAVQQALVGDDGSVTAAVVLVATLVGADVALSVLKQRFPRAAKWIDGVPLVLVEDGRPLRDRMARERVDEDDILEAARLQHGLERLDQVKYAVLERGGKIAIVPRR
ncbi:MAG TPA: YetF domain-containing protein [Thermodesulfobacteriota bacterium]|nr:YetF domain-containing protein [Thermodesulfobacteriota bacterium]